MIDLEAIRKRRCRLWGKEDVDALISEVERLTQELEKADNDLEWHRDELRDAKAEASCRDDDALKWRNQAEQAERERDELREAIQHALDNGPYMATRWYEVSEVLAKALKGDVPMQLKPEIILQRRINAALVIMDQYGRIEGDHHRNWVIQEALRILHGWTRNQLLEFLEETDWEKGIAP